MKYALLATLLVVSTGCAQVMAIQKAGPLNANSVLIEGMERGRVASKLGRAVSEETVGGRKVEVYNYEDGGGRNNGVMKTTRVLLYTIGDLYTVWLSQLVWMGLEASAFEETELSTRVVYRRSGTEWLIDEFETWERD